MSRAQAVHPATYIRRRGTLAMLTRFWQTVQLLTLVRNPAPAHHGVLPARSLAFLSTWGLPHLAAIAAFAAACQGGSSSRWRTLVLVALPVATVARMAGAYAQ